MADSSSVSFPSLTVLGGDKAGTRFLLEEAVDNVLVGSDPSCRFCIESSGVSPVHARIWIDDTGITVYDTNSPRGLYVNDDRVEGQVRLRNGDIIWLGPPGDEQSVMMQCRVPSRDAKGAATPTPAPTATPVAVSDFAIEGETVALPSAPGPVPIPATLVQAAPAIPVQEFEEEMGEPEETVAVQAAPHPTPAPTPAKVTPVPEPHAPVLGATPVPTPAPAATPRPTPHAPTHVTPHTLPPTAPPAARTSAPPPVVRTAAPAPRVPHPPQASKPQPHPHPHPHAEAAPPRASGGGAGKVVGILVAAVVVLGVAAGSAWFLFIGPALTRRAAGPSRPPTTAPSPAPTTPPAVTATPEPQTTATPAPTPEAVEVIIPVKPSPTPTPAKTPTPARTTPTPAPAGPSAEAVRAQQNAARLSGLLEQAQAAYAGQRFEAAEALYDEASKLDPQNTQASAGRASAAAAAFCWKRSFVSGRTNVQSGKDGKASLDGFESADVKVAKAPDYSGMIDFQVSPSRVKPGDQYSVRVNLTNDGKKAFRVASAVVTLVVNDERRPLSAAAPAGEVPSRAVVTLAQTGGGWPDGVRTWRVEVSVTTQRGETFSNQVSWR